MFWALMILCVSAANGISRDDPFFHAEDSAICEDPVGLDLSSAEVIQNNLGGFGPDSGSHEIRLGNVTLLDNRIVDLVIVNTSLYVAGHRHNNGLGRSDIVRINTRADAPVTVNFGFVYRDTGAPALVPRFYFTAFDLDGWDDVTEWFKMFNYQAYYVVPGSEVVAEKSKDDNALIFTSSGSGEDPSSVYSLTNKQRMLTVAFLFTYRSSFSATLGIDVKESKLRPQRVTRNFLFGGKSAVTCEATAGSAFVTADDFEAPYVINWPGTYYLTEDVVFEPQHNSSEVVCGLFPRPDSSKYPQLGGYFLGFFAAVVIQAPNVTFDCQGHTIRMSEEFHRRQRFFSIFELASKPFVSAVGPPQFTNTLLSPGEPHSAVDVTIQNCRLGLSSHHGIHGNENYGVVLKNLTIFDFEVGGIHLNGASSVTMDNVEVGPSLLHTYSSELSHAVFLDHLVNTLLPSTSLEILWVQRFTNPGGAFDRIGDAGRGYDLEDCKALCLERALCTDVVWALASGRCILFTGCESSRWNGMWQHWTLVSAEHAQEVANVEITDVPEGLATACSADTEILSIQECEAARTASLSGSIWRGDMVAAGYDPNTYPKGCFVHERSGVKHVWFNSGAGGYKVANKYNKASICRKAPHHTHVSFAELMQVEMTLNGNVVTVGSILQPLHDELELFLHNTSGSLATLFSQGTTVPDGSAIYGIVLHKRGPAINEFGACGLEQALNSSAHETDVALTNIVIHDLDIQPEQWTRMIIADKQVMGPAGDVFRIMDVVNDSMAYKGDLLSDAQLAVGALKKYLTEAGVSRAEMGYYFGAVHVPDVVRDWAAGASDFDDVMSTASLRCDGDAMSHVNKGAVGLRAGFLDGITLTNVSISGISNWGDEDSDFTLCDDASYGGKDVFGAVFENCINVDDTTGLTVHAETLHSEHGGSVNSVHAVSTRRLSSVAKDDMVALGGQSNSDAGWMMV